MLLIGLPAIALGIQLGSIVLGGINAAKRRKTAEKLFWKSLRVASGKVRPPYRAPQEDAVEGTSWKWNCAWSARAETVQEGNGAELGVGEAPELARRSVVQMARSRIRSTSRCALHPAARAASCSAWSAPMAPARRVGGTDANPTAISAAQLSEWDATGVVEWWGHRDDMPEVPSQAAIVTLPSRGGEGLPKCLLEAAACGRALVATNIPGCREIVRPGENGILVPPRDPEALAHAIKCLVENGAMRDSFGRASRRIVEEEFAVEHVVQQTLALYGSALAEAN